MKKKLKNRLFCSVTVVGMISVFTSAFAGYALNSNAVVIKGVPSDITKVDVQACDSDHNPITTKAKTSISGGEVKIDGLSETGYYYATFYTNTAEIGSAEFFLGESGKVYSFGYDGGAEETFTQTQSLEFQKYNTYRILDISGKNTVKFEGVDDSAVKANVQVSYENGNYGNMVSDISVKENSASISSIGGKGEYSVDFLNANDEAVCFATFNIGESNEVLVNDFVFDDKSGKWTEEMIKTDTVYVETYDDYLADIGGTDDLGYEASSVTISGLTSNVVRMDLQATDLELNELVTEPVYNISSGKADIGNLFAGCYFVNFYNSSEDVVGYSKFYLDDNGKIYDYEFLDNEPQLTEVTKIVFNSVAQEKEYQFGNITVSIYGVPDDIDNVESYYLYGNRTDESILFEPEYSSLFAEPFNLSKLGQKGNYKISFLKNNEVVGNATFSINESGKVCEIDYVYNDKTGTWDAVMVESDEIYYFENTDIEDADDYNYGSTKFTITNVPSDVKTVVSTYFGDDDTFTYGERFFPNTVISNGSVSLTNLGQSGYYEFELAKDDEMTRVGYIFVYVDEKMNTYLYETSINTDIMQLETTTTKMSTAKLTRYVNDCVDYEEGNYTVSISGVPKTVNNILVTVVGESNGYASFDRNIVIGTDGIAKLDRLGMNGDYTVTFMTGNDVIGSARFYLKDGKTYDATYSGDYEISLSEIKNVKFIPTDDTIEYQKGDMDLNGTVSIADAVLLQKYLLCSAEINASQFSIADMNDDNNIDVFDMVMLRKQVIKNLNS